MPRYSTQALEQINPHFLLLQRYVLHPILQLQCIASKGYGRAAGRSVMIGQSFVPISSPRVNDSPPAATALDDTFLKNGALPQWKMVEDCLALRPL